ncbi:MAG: galactose-1-phosphate uridylyltransferase [candidate division WOR-3 bacterium]
MPELRKDPVLGRWVIISTERSRRPSDFRRPAHQPVTGHNQPCPFCPGNEHLTPPEIMRRPESGQWSVRVVPNRFPALTPEGQPVRQGVGVYDKMTGIGAHEVIIETPDHCLSLADVEPGHFSEVIWTFHDRHVALSADPRLRYVLVFKNHGAGAGASLAHSHSQLIAMPVVPVLVKSELEGAAQYFRFRNRCVYCDMLKQELQETVRLVFENDSFVVFQPFAPRFPFETWVVSRRHLGSFATMDAAHVTDLALALKDILGRMNRGLSGPDFNFVVHSAPLTEPDPEYYHFHIELMPKLTTIAGFEVGTGFYINPVPPEDAACFLRQQSG